MERLNKYLAHAGVGSRRHCDSLIAGGRVKIDGEIVRTLGVQIDPAKNRVAVDDQMIRSEKLVYCTRNGIKFAAWFKMQKRIVKTTVASMN